jgi:NADPH:quinone reductase-like Zn-dependent oxidoreductase
VQIHQTGDLDVIQEDQVPVPTPKDDEVLIKVSWT